MPRRRTRARSRTTWPPAIRHIIASADAEGPRGHAQALRELTALALTKVPARGIFDPTVRGEHEMFAAIESTADAWLQFAEARSAWRAALKAADLDLERRDEIERALLLVQTVSDTAYFYAGLAFGMAAFCVYRDG